MVLFMIYSFFVDMLRMFLDGRLVALLPVIKRVFIISREIVMVSS